MVDTTVRSAICGGGAMTRDQFTCPVCGHAGARIVRYNSSSPWYAPLLTCVECVTRGVMVN